MELVLLRLFLVICTLKPTTENPISTYRFKVYPVDKCPMNATEFEAAAYRRNCTGHSRYLCAPDKYLSNLIEFCTDTRRSLFGKGNCLRLEGTGGLNHYRCVDSFKTGCPTEPYTDEEIYRYPACLEINEVNKCFVAEKHCPERDSGNGKQDPKKPSESYASLVYIYSVILVVIGICLGFYIKRRKKNEGGKLRKEDVHIQSSEDQSEASSEVTEKYSLLKEETVSNGDTDHAYFPENDKFHQNSSRVLEREENTYEIYETKTETRQMSISDIPIESRNELNLLKIIQGPLTDLLRDILLKEISPSVLSQKVKELAKTQKNKKKLITKEQETLIHDEEYSKFDITLLYILIRNFTQIPPHTKRWGNEPSAGDKSVSANIERVRSIRNTFAHTARIHMSDTEYDHKWKESFDIVQGLEMYLGASTSYQDTLKQFKICSMDHSQGTETSLTILKIQENILEKLEEIQKCLPTYNTKEERSLPQGTIISSIKPSENDRNLPERHTKNDNNIVDLPAEKLRTELLKLKEASEQIMQMQRKILKDGCLKCSSQSSFVK